MSANRRTFLQATAGALALASGSPVPARAAAISRPAAADPDVAFFLVSDTHYLAERDAPERLDEASLTTNGRLIETLNRLPGTPIPESAGGGAVAMPRGVIHGGDLIDSGDKRDPGSLAMQPTEWRGFVADYGLDGTDGRLRYPVYEVHGNHDSPDGQGPILPALKARTARRPGLVNVSANGLHYSWDWGPIHLVNLGLVVGSDPSVTRKRRYAPLDSLAFLVADLAEHVGSTGRPVIVTHHVDLARYSTEPDPTGPPTQAEWDPVDVRAYHRALAGTNVVAILYGHTHVRNVYRWDGTPKPADQGPTVFNTDNAAHFSGPKQALFYFAVQDGALVARELATDDGWESCHWTPQTWRCPLSGARV